MHRDVRDIAADSRLESDVIVVGAGPLGIVVALELAGQGHRVMLVESGRLRPDADVQRLSDDPSRSDDYYHVDRDLAVRRQVGGSSTMWGGRCVPFDPVDFSPRPLVPEKLWPVSYEEMAAYLPRACRWCVCGEAVFNAREIPSLRERDMIPGLPDGEVRTTDLERWSLPTRFNKEYGGRIKAHPLIDLVTGLTCIEIVTASDGKVVDHLELRSLDGLSVTADAQRYVLATGGLEATRLLMVSDRFHPGGIGNHSGHLGRWYMAHVGAKAARIHLSAEPGRIIYGHERDQDGVYVRRRFTFSEEYLRRESMPNAAIWVINPEMADASHGSGILSVVYLTLISPAGRFLLAEGIRRIVTKTSRPSSIPAHLRNVVTDIAPAGKFALTFTYERFLRRGIKAPGFFVGSAANVFLLEYHGEHLPHWESRVELSEERDSLGLRRLTTNMHFSDREIARVRLGLDRIDAHLREHAAGHIEYIDEDVGRLVKKQLAKSAGYHQTGTTRMSASPEDGVVDSNLAVHGVRALFVAATSVFPTSSQANPTLTGVAFAVRLADHIAGGLSASG